MHIKPYFKNIESYILKDLEKADSDVKIAVTWFTNRKLFNALLAQVKEGKNCSVVILNDQINRQSELNWQEFILFGGKLFFPKEEMVVHHKFMIIDRLVVISGSYNWTVNAENKNLENILCVEDIESALVFSDEFSRVCSFCDLINNLDDCSVYDYSFIRKETEEAIENNKDSHQLIKVEMPQVNDRAIMHRLGTFTWWDVTVDEVSEMDYSLSWKTEKHTIDNKTRVSAGLRVDKADSRYAVLKYNEDYIRGKKLFKIPANLPLI